MRTRDLLVVLACCAGCGGTPVPSPPPPKPAKFDPQDSETTFRWLSEIAEPLMREKDLMGRRQHANPLSANFESEEKAIKAKWTAATAGVHGKRVTWPAVVRKITTEGIYVDAWESGWDKGGARYHQYLAFQNGPTSRPTYSGFLPLGTCIALNDARKLMPGDWVWGSGQITKMEASLDTMGYISVDVSGCKVQLPEGKGQ